MMNPYLNVFWADAIPQHDCRPTLQAWHRDDNLRGSLSYERAKAMVVGLLTDVPRHCSLQAQELVMKDLELHTWSPRPCNR